MNLMEFTCQVSSEMAHKLRSLSPSMQIRINFVQMKNNWQLQINKAHLSRLGFFQVVPRQIELEIIATNIQNISSRNYLSSYWRTGKIFRRQSNCNHNEMKNIKTKIVERENQNKKTRAVEKKKNKKGNASHRSSKNHKKC